MIFENKVFKKQIGGTHWLDYPIPHVVFSYYNNLNNLESNIIKYIVRHRQHEGAEDIKKLIHYAEMILEMEYGEK